MTSGGDRFVQLLAMPQLVDGFVLEASRPASRVSPSSLEDEAAQRLSFSRTGAFLRNFSERPAKLPEYPIATTATGS